MAWPASAAVLVDRNASRAGLADCRSAARGKPKPQNDTGSFRPGERRLDGREDLTLLAAWLQSLHASTLACGDGGLGLRMVASSSEFQTKKFCAKTSSRTNTSYIARHWNGPIVIETRKDLKSEKRCATFMELCRRLGDEVDQAAW